MNNRNIFRRLLPYQQYHAVWWLIGLNFLFFVIAQTDFMYTQSMSMGYVVGEKSPVFHMLLFPEEALSGDFWQFIGYGFLHGDMRHLIFNMIAIFFFAPQIEHSLGSNEFVLFYVLSIVFVGVSSSLIYVASGMNIVMLGASGGVYAILLLWATLNPHGTILIWGIIPLTAPLMVILYTGLSVFGLLGNAGGVSHLGHLMGFVFAFIYALVRLGKNPIKELFMRRR